LNTVHENKFHAVTYTKHCHEYHYR
jgi:hypothetical protein